MKKLKTIFLCFVMGGLLSSLGIAGFKKLASETKADFADDTVFYDVSDQTKQYKNLDEIIALDASANSKTFKMVKDYQDLDKKFTFDGFQDVVIDLNGYTMDFSKTLADDAVFFIADSTITFTNTNSEHDSEIKVGNNGGFLISTTTETDNLTTFSGKLNISGSGTLALVKSQGNTPANITIEDANLICSSDTGTAISAGAKGGSSLIIKKGTEAFATTIKGKVFCSNGSFKTELPTSTSSDELLVFKSLVNITSYIGALSSINGGHFEDDFYDDQHKITVNAGIFDKNFTYTHNNSMGAPVLTIENALLKTNISYAVNNKAKFVINRAFFATNDTNLTSKVTLGEGKALRPSTYNDKYKGESVNTNYRYMVGDGSATMTRAHININDLKQKDCPTYVSLIAQCDGFNNVPQNVQVKFDEAVLTSDKYRVFNGSTYGPEKVGDYSRYYIRYDFNTCDLTIGNHSYEISCDNPYTSGRLSIEDTFTISKYSGDNYFEDNEGVLYPNLSSIINSVPAELDTNKFRNMGDKTFTLLKDYCTYSCFDFVKVSNMIIDLNGHNITTQSGSYTDSSLMYFGTCQRITITNSDLANQSVLDAGNASVIELDEDFEVLSFTGNVHAKTSANSVVKCGCPGCEGGDLYFNNWILETTQADGNAFNIDTSNFSLCLENGIVKGNVFLLDESETSEFSTSVGTDGLIFEKAVDITGFDIEIDGGLFKDTVYIEDCALDILDGTFEKTINFQYNVESLKHYCSIENGLFNGQPFMNNYGAKEKVVIKKAFFANDCADVLDKVTVDGGSFYRETCKFDTYNSNPVDLTVYPYTVNTPEVVGSINADTNNNYEKKEGGAKVKFVAEFEMLTGAPGNLVITLDGVELSSEYYSKTEAYTIGETNIYKTFTYTIELKVGDLNIGEHELKVEFDDCYHADNKISKSIKFTVVNAAPVAPEGNSSKDGKCITHIFSILLFTGYLAFVIVWNWVLKKEEHFIVEENKGAKWRVIKKHTTVPCGATLLAFIALILVSVFSHCAACVVFDILSLLGLSFGVCSFIIKDKMIALYKKVFKK